MNKPTIKAKIELYTDEHGKWFAQIEWLDGEIIGATRWTTAFVDHELALAAARIILNEMKG